MAQPSIHSYHTIKFERHTSIELPRPVLLETHAALVKILHASGMSEHLDKVLRDWEEIPCLAPDGSTDAARILFVV